MKTTDEIIIELVLRRNRLKKECETLREKLPRTPHPHEMPLEMIALGVKSTVDIFGQITKIHRVNAELSDLYEWITGEVILDS